MLLEILAQLRERRLEGVDRRRGRLAKEPDQKSDEPADGGPALARPGLGIDVDVEEHQPRRVQDARAVAVPRHDREGSATLAVVDRLQDLLARRPIAVAVALREGLAAPDAPDDVVELRSRHATRTRLVVAEAPGTDRDQLAVRLRRLGVFPLPVSRYQHRFVSAAILRVRSDSSSDQGASGT